MEGRAEVFVRNNLYRLSGQKDQVTVEEVNIQPDHVHLIISIPPKYSISEMMGFLKGKLAIRLFQEQKELLTDLETQATQKKVRENFLF